MMRVRMKVIMVMRMIVKVNKMMRMIVKVMVIKFISVLMGLVSITPVMLNLIDYPRLKLIELMIILLIINIKYFEIIHLITLPTINTNHYENKQTIVVSCNHTDDASYHTSIESRAN